MEKLPKIRVDFNISGDEFDLQYITDRMGISPTKTRTKNECPVPATALTYWRLSTDKEVCKAVCCQYEKIMKLLAEKELIINQLCKEYNLKTNFNIVIEMEGNNGPELVLTRQIILFISSICAEIGFDLYID
jgi:hypothetical protein